jgi:hypothetical protein
MATINNLLANVETIRVANSASAAQTEVDGTSVDMSGKIGVRFTAALGDVTTGSVLTLKAQGRDSSDDSWGDLSGSVTFTAGASDADNKVMILDVVRPETKFVRAVLTRTTANAVVDGVFADVYGDYWQPVEQGATVLASKTLPNAKVA